MVQAASAGRLFVGLLLLGACADPPTTAAAGSELPKELPADLRARVGETYLLKDAGWIEDAILMDQAVLAEAETRLGNSSPVLCDILVHTGLDLFLATDDRPDRYLPSRPAPKTDEEASALLARCVEVSVTPRTPNGTTGTKRALMTLVLIRGALGDALGAEKWLELEVTLAVDRKERQKAIRNAINELERLNPAAVPRWQKRLVELEP